MLDRSQDGVLFAQIGKEIEPYPEIGGRFLQRPAKAKLDQRSGVVIVAAPAIASPTPGGNVTACASPKVGRLAVDFQLHVLSQIAMTARHLDRQLRSGHLPVGIGVEPRRDPQQRKQIVRE